MSQGADIPPPERPGSAGRVPADPLLQRLATLLDAPPKDLSAMARSFVLDACDGTQDEVRDRVLVLIDHMEMRAFELSRLLAVRGPEEGLMLVRAVDVVDAVRDAALPFLDESPPDIMTELDDELDWLVDLVPAADPSEGTLSDLRRRLDRQIVNRLEVLARIPSDRVAAGAGLQAIGEAMKDLAPRGQTDLIDRLGHLRARLWRTILERARGLEGKAARTFLDALADEVNDRGEDALARADSPPVESSIRLLETATRDVRRALALHRHLGHRGRSRELSRMRRRLLAAVQDRRVRTIQLRQVGYRGLRVIELLVLLAIIGVLGILAYDVAASPTEEVRIVLDRIDAGICAFFLLEFTWRWVLSGWSVMYLWRCFFIDVLPSIPFGFLTSGAAMGGDAVRALRAGRLIRLLRVLRLLRPAFQIYRLLAFTLQGMDRIVRRNAHILNRNIVIFDPARQEVEGSISAAVRLRAFRSRLQRALRLTLSELPSPTRSPLLELRADALRYRFDHALHCQLRDVQSERVDLRDIRVEVLIEELLSLEPMSVEVGLGEETAGRLARMLALFDLPGIRRLPFLRDTVAGTSGLDPYQALAAAGEGMGRFMDRLLERARTIGDLTGIVTGAQLLDRVGSTFVKATQRPAVRLLLFGFAAVIVSWLIDLINPPAGHFLDTLATFLKKILGTGVIVLGAVCLVIQAFGRWIRKVAGEASELYQKVAEAQGINLIKLQKLAFRERDLAVLFDRVLAREFAVRGLGDDGAAAREERVEFLRLVPHEAHGRPSSDLRLGQAHDQIILLYLDYLDGGILHSSNVKSTEQFLGNLELQAIRLERLCMEKKELKHLRGLDLHRDRPVPTGPYLWFRFITESLAQRVARLVIHYNRSAIPLSDMPFCSEGRRKLQTSWLAPRRTTSQGRPAPSETPTLWRVIRMPNVWLMPLETLNILLWPFAAGVALVHALRALRDRDSVQEHPIGDESSGAYFNALHFLTVDMERDTLVARTFGKEVLDQLIRDRRLMVREVFSSYPWELMPRHRRTFNPYTLYFNWLGRGRIVLLPLRLLWKWLRIWARALGLFLGTIKEQLRPDQLRQVRPIRLATEEVAIRKINRMHLPLFMAALDMRTRFDPEYMEVPLPGGGPTPMGTGSMREDLDLIGAREYRREALRERRTMTEARVERLEALLRRRGWPERDLWSALGTANERGPSSLPAEALRAVTVAWVIDYRQCRTLLTANRDIQRALETFLGSPGEARPRRRLWRRGQRALLRAYLPNTPFEHRPEPDQGLIRTAVARNRANVRDLMRVLTGAGGQAAAEAQGLAILAAVARHPSPWTRQLVTLRTVQTLTCLDILNARRVVIQLGGYREQGTPETV